MPTFTEDIHRAGAFMLSKFPGGYSFERSSVAAGQVLKAGTVVQFVDQFEGADHRKWRLEHEGMLIACTGELATDGTLVTPVAGVLFESIAASAGAVSARDYIAREAEVKGFMLIYPEESTAGGEKAAVIASLRKLNIAVR